MPRHKIVCSFEGVHTSPCQLQLVLDIYIYVCFLPPLSLVNCSGPTFPANGSIEAYHNTTEGAEIFFRCNPGFVPAGRMRAVCGADGRWNPDPGDHVCTCESSHNVYAHVTATMCTFKCTYTAYIYMC